MSINFYTLDFGENRLVPKIKEGAKVLLKNNILYLNGVIAQEIYQKPQVRTLEDSDLEKLFFLYPENAMWVAKEVDNNYYLYKGMINEENLYLSPAKNFSKIYAILKLSGSDKVSIDDGRVVSRIFDDDNQTCIVEMEVDSNIIVEREKAMVILTWNGKQFICK